MSYLGRGTDKISNIEILDNITFDGSSSYSITKSSVAFVPNSAQSLLISIDGVVQATNFTISGSTIDFGTAVAGTSTCDFILHYGVGLITTPADGTVSLAKLSATGNKDATTFLRGDNTFAEAGGGITEADQWRLTTDITSDVNPIASNLERVDDASFSKIGTGMSVSSGTWTFPSTGLYFVKFKIYGDAVPDDNVVGKINTTTDNSSYDDNAFGIFCGDGSTVGSGTGVAEYFFNVTNTSTHKLQFQATSIASGGRLQGNTLYNLTNFTFIRLGDSQ